MKHMKTDFDMTIENFKTLENKVLKQMDDGTLIAGVNPDFTKLIIRAKDYTDIIHVPVEGLFCMGGVGVEAGYMVDAETNKPLAILKITSKRIRDTLQKTIVK